MPDARVLSKSEYEESHSHKPQSITAVKNHHLRMPDIVCRFRWGTVLCSRRATHGRGAKQPSASVGAAVAMMFVFAAGAWRGQSCRRVFGQCEGNRMVDESNIKSLRTTGEGPEIWIQNFDRPEYYSEHYPQPRRSLKGERTRAVNSSHYRGRKPLFGLCLEMVPPQDKTPGERNKEMTPSLPRLFSLSSAETTSERQWRERG